jgi:hypothetical protein
MQIVICKKFQKKELMISLMELKIRLNNYVNTFIQLLFISIKNL